MEVRHERLHSNRRGGSGTRVVGLELTWWRQETSDQARVDTVGVRHERLRSN